MERSRPIEYELGEADGNLGLSEVAELRGQVEQALTSAQLALQRYTDKRNALGTAHTNRVLGEINMRRGQLSYANSTMESALRTYKAIAYRIGQAETTAGLGDIQRRRGFLATALQTYNEALNLANKLQDELVESRALLGMGEVYRQQGQTGQAAVCYRNAQDHMEQLGERAGVAEAQVLLARLAVFGGQLGEAIAYLSKAASNITPVIYPVKASPLLSLVQGQLLLTQGDFVQAEEGFGAAYKQAEGQQEPQLAAEALAGMARVKLSQGELDAASTMFTEARRRFQLLESTDGE
ncbi:MAG: tetratricopeptide repeat protein, partial [Chloroflexi bacterium]